MSPAADRLASLREAAIVLFGERWQRPVARALHVNDRTVRRWVARHSPLPANTEEKMAKLLLAKMREIHELIERSANPVA